MPEFNVMEAIWLASPKAQDGNLHYPEAFIDFLWDNGFVDTAKYPKETWKAAFEAFKQKEGNYKITHDEFLTLDKYRYRGELHVPFDALRINEGKYTDEGFLKLVSESVAPSCSLPPDLLQKYVEELKNEFRQEDDLLLIKAPAKQKIKKLLEENPSPLRKLEILFDDMLKAKAARKEIEELQRQAAPTATPEQMAALQQSTFTSGASSYAEEQAQRLKDVAKAKPASETSPAEGEPLKKIRRSKKGLRG